MILVLRQLRSAGIPLLIASCLFIGFTSIAFAQGGSNDGAGGHGTGDGGAAGDGYGVGDGNSGPGGSGEIGDGMGGTVDGAFGIGSQSDTPDATSDESESAVDTSTSKGGLFGRGGFLGLGLGRANSSSNSSSGTSKGFLGIGTPNGFLGLKGLAGKLGIGTGIGKNAASTDKYADLSSINAVATPSTVDTEESVSTTRGGLESSKGNNTSNSRGGLESSKSESSVSTGGSVTGNTGTGNTGISGTADVSSGDSSAGSGSGGYDSGGYGHAGIVTRTRQLDYLTKTDLNFEVRITDAEGALVQDWTADNVAVENDEEVDFRWDCSDKCTQTYADIPQNGFAAGFNTGGKEGNTITSEVDVKEASRVYSVQGEDTYGNIVTAGIDVIYRDPLGTPYPRQTDTLAEIEAAGTTIIKTEETYQVLE